MPPRLSRLPGSSPVKVGLLHLLNLLGGERAALRLAGRLYHLEVEGRQYIPRQGPALFVINHVSPIADGLIFLLLHQQRPDLCLSTWQGLAGQFGQVISALHPGLGDPSSRLVMVFKGYGLSAEGLYRARQLLLGGAALLLAPEGEITWDGRLQDPLEPGAAWLALRSGAPVVPVVSLGGYDVQPRWQMQTTRLTGRIRIIIGPPFQFEPAMLQQYDEAVLQAASRRIRRAMQDLLED